jgi:steroid delta-isomerase-like uncharacterized protein
VSEENKTLIRRWVEEVVNSRNLAVMDEIVAPHYAFYVASRATPADREGHKQLLTAFLGAFPDLRRNIEEMVGEGNKVVERWTDTGTHQGEFEGLAPTGKPISYAGITVWRIDDGKIVENRTVQDFMGLMQQLGAERIPEQPPSQRL